MAAVVEHVGVDHGGADVTMPAQFLNRPKVVAVFEQVVAKE